MELTEEEIEEVEKLYNEFYPHCAEGEMVVGVPNERGKLRRFVQLLLKKAKPETEHIPGFLESYCVDKSMK